MEITRDCPQRYEMARRACLWDGEKCEYLDTFNRRFILKIILGTEDGRDHL
jgi:hypothetical protein